MALQETSWRQPQELVAADLLQALSVQVLEKFIRALLF